MGLQQPPRHHTAKCTKILTHILLRHIRAHLLRYHRPEQYRFTPGKSTVDHIMALQVIVECHHKFKHGLLEAYIDLKKGFDLVHQESLWEILRLRGIPTRIIGLIASLYPGTEIAVKTTIQSHCGTTLGNIKVTDFNFTDVAILSESLETLVVALDAFSNEAKPLGIEVSWTKTKIQDSGDLPGEPVQLMDCCGSRGHELSRQEYLEMPVHAQDQATCFQGHDNAMLSFRDYQTQFEKFLLFLKGSYPLEITDAPWV
ncbi:uncharacterized protein [Penaeus vannamei]|uniref:uncharacterized protein n=1 Tax=Penaeus vannamei TaxID=6689 RepID=UPI00387F6015